MLRESQVHGIQLNVFPGLNQQPVAMVYVLGGNVVGTLTGFGPGSGGYVLRTLKNPILLQQEFGALSFGFTDS